MKNKFLIILISFIFFICLFSVSSFASVDNDTFTFQNPFSSEDVTLKLPKGYGVDYKYFLINCSVYKSYHDYSFFLSNEVLTYKSESSGGRLLCTSGDTVYYLYTVRYSNKINVIDFSEYSISDLSSSGIGFGSNQFGLSSCLFVYSNYDLKDNSGSMVHPNDLILNPSFVTNKDKIKSGDFDVLRIDAGFLDGIDDCFYFNIYNVYDIGDGVYSPYGFKQFVLNRDSSYFKVGNLNVYYDIPRDKLGIDFSNGKMYRIDLSSEIGGYGDVYDYYTFTVEGLSEEQEKENSDNLLNSKIDEQNEKLEDGNKNTKGIWDSLLGILDLLNPFSENFFVYKLIELLVEAIKSLFIPSDNFFSDYFTGLKEWFSDRLGFLFYPFDLILDLLDKIVNINFSEPILNIPNINEPFTNTKLISATTFNLNDMLNNNIFKTIHDLYFIGVDALIIIGLVNLAKKKWEEVSNK